MTDMPWSRPDAYPLDDMQRAMDKARDDYLTAQRPTVSDIVAAIGQCPSRVDWSTVDPEDPFDPTLWQQQIDRDEWFDRVRKLLNVAGLL